MAAPADRARSAVGAQPGVIEPRAGQTPMDAEPCGQRLVIGKLLRIADEDARGGVAEKILDLRRRIACVERQEDSSGADHGKIKHDGFDGFRRLHGNTVAGPDAEVDQHIGETARHIFDIAIAVAAAIVGQGCKQCVAAVFAVQLAGEQSVKKIVVSHFHFLPLLFAAAASASVLTSPEAATLWFSAKPSWN
jgi:hypothetical protein